MATPRSRKTAREAWRPLVESYLGARGALAGVVLIVDVRRGLEEEEHQLLDFLATLAVPRSSSRPRSTS